MLSLISQAFDIAIKILIEKLLSCRHFVFILIYVEVTYF